LVNYGKENIQMKFPTISEAMRLERLAPPTGKVRMVLDTDTYNEIDDQFAVTYAMVSPEQMSVEALYAAPFFNDRSNGPADGMEKSYEEILRLLDRLGTAPTTAGAEATEDANTEHSFVFRGATAYLSESDMQRAATKPPEAIGLNEAAQDLVEKAMAGPPPLYVVAIGAITNIASAILIEPQIIENIVVVWLGGQPLHWPTAREFNLQQDLHASRLIFDCGVPLVQIPCSGVASHLLTTAEELERHMQGNAISDYLVETFKAYRADHTDKPAWAKVIWDIAGIAYLIDAAWVPTTLVHSPILTDHFTWSTDHNRHFIRQATFVHRNPIFNDLFAKLKAHA
jgi:inosine-uridine nucleoside N-ribohydrolase